MSALAAGYLHTCALANGNVYCWGSNLYGELGNGSTTGSLVPVAVQGLPTDITAIAVGRDHTCASANDGVYCWGRNFDGQLGDNTAVDRTVPVRVVF